MKLECGCDEAGRGAGAGEVYVGAVILNPKRPITGLEKRLEASMADAEKTSQNVGLTGAARFRSDQELLPADF